MHCMEGQQHLWDYYKDVAKRRGVQAERSPAELGLPTGSRARRINACTRQVTRELD